MRSFGLCLKLQLSLLTGRVAERFGNPFHPALESESQHPMTNVLSRFFRSLAEAAETKGADLPEWNLDDLYPGMDSPALKSDLDEARGRAEAFKERWRGHLAELAAQDPSDLAASVREFEALEELLGRVISYAGLVYAGDTSDPVRAKFYGDIQAIITDISTHLLFYTLELNRIEDAVSTTKAAIEEGVVAGGGVTLLRAQVAARAAGDGLSADEATGARIVAKALEAPLHQIAVNAGLDGGVVVEKVRSLKGPNGLNAETEEYEDLIAAGIIDAAKVTRSALQNAGSIAALFLTTDVVIADAPSGGADGGMGGMGGMDF